MKKDALRGWTASELVAELRERERRSGGAGAVRVRARSAAAGGVQGAASGRSRDLRGVATGSIVAAARQRQRVVYGVDGRKDLYRVRSARVRAAADAVCALVASADLTKKPGGSYALATQVFGDAYDLCGNEPFVSQPIGCFCSGFLVAPDVVATAGHCVKSQSDLSGIRFVFGFRMIDAAEARTSFPAKDVYSGAELLGRKLSSDGTDWALVRLDRAVEGRKPVAFRKSGKIGAKRELFVIGHPCGLPQKYAGGAQVRDNAPAPYFVANLDTYGGNSGSPVFAADTVSVEGILVRGENDFVSDGTCYVSLVCPTTGCRGEDVTRTTVWASKVPAAKATGRERRPAARRKRRSRAARRK